MGYSEIKLDKNEAVATITLNKPDRMNGVGLVMVEEIISAIKDVAADESVKVLVLTGAGRAFCAGGNLESPLYQIKDPLKMHEVIQAFGQISVALRSLPKPVIAMVNGAAVGAGFSFALACDFIYASDKAKLGHVYLNLGVQSDGGGTYFLPRLIGTAKALEFIYSGAVIGAEEALQMGLVNRVFPAEELEAQTMKMAKKLTTRPTMAMAMAKSSVYQGMGMDLESAVEFEARAHTIAMLSDNLVEGMAAFKEKRPPKFA